MPTESGISFANFISLRYFRTIRGVINKVILNRYIILMFGSDQDIHVIVNIPRSIVCSDWTSCLLVLYICKGGN